MKKMLSWMLAVSFLFPSSFPVRAEVSETLDLSSLAIPESLGKIQDRFTGTGNRWVIQIQDVHGHVAAQENIAAILDHLQAVYGVSTVGVEGAWGSTTLEKVWGLPNSREKQQLSRALLDDGYLTGPGYAAIFSQMPLQLVGVEDPALYQKNRRLFLTHLDAAEETTKKITIHEALLSQEKNKFFNPELLSFDKKLHDFREGLKSEAFLPALISLATEHKIDLLHLDHVARFAKILEISQVLNKEKLEAEAKRLVSTYKTKRLSFEELIRSGQVKEEDLQFYPEIQKYTELMKLQDGISHHEFFDQIEKLIAQVKDTLFVSEDERTLDQRAEWFAVAKKMLTLKATPKDVRLYHKDRDVIDPLIAEAGLTEALSLAEKFYDLAQKRDRVFFEELISDEHLKSNTAIVTGGFHTEGLSEKLREAGVSYIVITPDLAGQAPDEAMYHAKLKMDAPAGTLTTPPHPNLHPTGGEGISNSDAVLSENSPRPSGERARVRGEGIPNFDESASDQTLAPEVQYIIASADFAGTFVNWVTENKGTNDVRPGVSAILGISGTAFTSSSVVPANPVDKKPVQDFFTLSPEMQWTTLQLAIKEVQTGAQKMFFATDQTAFEGLFPELTGPGPTADSRRVLAPSVSSDTTQSTLRQTLFDHFASAKGTTLLFGVTQSVADVPSQLVGTSLRLDTRVGKVGEILKIPGIQSRYRELLKGYSAVMTDDPDLIAGESLKFPVHPVAFLFREILSNPILRAAYQLDPAKALSTIESLLVAHLDELAATLRSA